MQDLLTKAYHILQAEFQLMFETSVKMLPRVIIAILLIWLFYFLGKLFKRASQKILHKFLENGVLVSALGGIIYYGFVFAGIFSALSALQLSKAVTSLLAGAGFIGLAMTFAFQDLATNLISGFFITIQKPFKIGDFIETHNYLGYVKEIKMRTVTIEDVDGEFIIIPSKDIFQTPLVNYSSKKFRRIRLTVSVSYGEDLEKVAEITEKAISELDIVEKNQAIMVHFYEFADSSINFFLKFWINKTDQFHYEKAVSQAIVAVKKAYDKHNVVIPFPIRTLDFGIKGGTTLKEMLGDKPS
jgi:small conductance mechanosensitive channel